MKDNVNLGQTVGLAVVRKAVTCSQCGEPRTQDARCENCGCETPYLEERKNEDS